jgi:hypothetical protein
MNFNSNHKILSYEYIPQFYINLHKLYILFKKQPSNIQGIKDQSPLLEKYIKINILKEIIID